MSTEPSDSLFLRRERNSSTAVKGDYGLVPLTRTGDEYDDNNDVDGDEDCDPMKVHPLELEQGMSSSSLASPSSDTVSSWHRILFVPLLPDDRFYCCGWMLLDGIEGVRMIKFIATTWIGLFVMYYFVRYMVRMLHASPVACLSQRCHNPCPDPVSALQ